MKPTRRLIGIALLAFACSSRAAEDAQTVEFRALETAWSEAIRAQDRTALEAFLSPDYTLTVARPTRLEVTPREEWLGNAVTSYRLHEFEFTEIAVRRIGDVAIVSSRYKQRATVDGRDRSGDAFLTDVWLRTGGTWTVSARYSSDPKQGKPAQPAGAENKPAPPGEAR
jgi:ketosteroid isomerase-like protein